MGTPPSCSRFDSTRGDQKIARDFLPRNASWQAVGNVRASSTPSGTPLNPPPGGSLDGLIWRRGV